MSCDFAVLAKSLRATLLRHPSQPKEEGAVTRSKASFRGHPSHPALIPFPLAFMTGAFVFDLAGVFLRAPALWTTGAHLALAGVVTGVLAAIPGVVDLVYTVPPNSSGKKRAIRHMLSMVSAMAIFAFARWLRGDAANSPDTIVLGIEALGTIALMFGGWLGGTLVSRNQVSVDHRYANAGKWHEENVAAPTGNDPITIDATGLEVNQMRLLRVGDRRIVVGRTADGYVAFDDHCPHRGGSLAGGVMICGTVQCPWHGSQFDTATGDVKAGPAKESISVYRVERRDGMLLVFGVAKA
jgi:nitrite reductase/ring-hydroxylating ferredoxin subunit/uncharacterized membrane protein